jgi:predicted phosphodiesterase
MKFSRTSVVFLFSLVVGMVSIAALLLLVFLSPTVSDGLEYGSIRRIGIKPASQIGKTRIAAVGDIACTPSSLFFNGLDPKQCQHVKVSELIQKEGANFVLGLGDLQYETGTLSDYNASFDQFAAPIRSKIKPVPGNHEYGTTNAAGYWAYFGTQAATPQKGWYSFDTGNWHIVGLNSNCTFVGCDAGSEQYTWLQNDLNASTKPCTIAMWHHPRFNSGSTHGSSTAMNQIYSLLDQKNADIVLQGHDHLYERFGKLDVNGAANATGIRSFVSGAGGKNLYNFGTTVSGSEAQYNANFGVLFITLDANSYTWEFKSVTGAVIDKGSDSCV